eukprot:scaffold9425_cov97-Cylindrotheca_fusiformis.AAC.2
MTSSIQCHYDILSVPRDADASTIKKAHRKMALKYHPDKNLGNEDAACERKQDETLIELPTDIGTADSEWSYVQNFYQHWESFVSALNFAWEDKYNVMEDAPNRRVRRLMEDENRKARRAAKKTYNQDVLALVSFVKRRDPRVKAKKQEMEEQKLEQQRQQKIEAEERKREQQLAKEAWQEEAAAAMMEAAEEDRLAGRVRLADLEDDYDYGGGKKKKGRGKKKKNKQLHVEEVEGHAEPDENVEDDAAENGTDSLPKEEENDQIAAENSENGEIGENDERDENGENSQMLHDEEDDEEYFSEESSSEEKPDTWRCECCKKDFKSEGQMENHMKSKKHKQAFKKYEAKLKKQEEEEMMAEMMDDIVIDQ